MKQELKLWKFVYERLEQNRSVILLVVATSSGSSPGRQGFKMAVAENELFGSIGGGVMEVSLVEQARRILNEQTKGFVETQIHQKNSSNSSGMICSGRQSVIFFKLTPEQAKLIRKIPVFIKKHRGRYLRIINDDLSFPLNLKNKSRFNFQQISKDEFIYEEFLCSDSSKLFIVGGGHCGLALSELMSKMDFEITLFDDRPDLNTIEKNKFVHEKKIIESYNQIGKHIASGVNHYVVVMTLGYKFDEIVIRKLFDKNFRYFGVLGSKAKMAVLMRELEKDGFDKERLERIHTPIGISINSRTPEEIAVSIAAEIIAVKNSKE